MKFSAAVLLLAAALCAGSASALTHCEQRCRADGYAPVCANYAGPNGRIVAAVYPNACTFSCDLGSDRTAHIVARNIRQQPKCENQYEAVGYMAGSCLTQGCKVAEPPAPSDLKACQAACRRRPFAPVCAIATDGSLEPFENDCMYACYVSASGITGTRVVARDIEWAMPSKCRNQYQATGTMVGWCKQESICDKAVGAIGSSGVGAARRSMAEDGEQEEQEAGFESDDELESLESFGEPDEEQEEHELPAPIRKQAPRRAARRLAAWDF